MTNEDFTPTGSFDSDYSAICTALNYSQMPILLKKPDSLNYKFTPHVSKTMINEDDDDEVKISVSGWKLFPGTIHAFSLCLTACPLITHLSFFFLI